MPTIPLPDPSLSRRRRARHVHRYEQCSRVPREITDRLMEHLDPIRCDPRRVLELGAATGHLRRTLVKRFPRAQILSADDCSALLRAGPRPPWPLRRPTLLCCDPGALPLPAASVDLLVCNLALLHTRQPEAALADWQRVLREGALLLLVSLGPRSFSELSRTWESIDATPHLHPYADMHDLGDALVKAGFQDVVMDSQRLQVQFDDLGHLMRELRTVGGGNSMPTRAPGLLTPRQLERLSMHYEAQSNADGCWATVEAVFAHAWVRQRPGMEVAPPTNRS